MQPVGKKILLIGGLGHSDLSGKVPRPGLLLLRQSLRKAGHDAVIDNYSTSLADQLFPASFVDQLRTIYQRSIKPMIVEGKNPILRPWKLPRLLRDMKALKDISQELIVREQTVYRQVGDDLSARIKDEAYDAVGFSLYLGGSTTGAIIIADILRQNQPDLPIIFGGPQTTHFAETIYRETSSPTALVIGEGEKAIVEIADRLDALKAGRLADLSSIPNIVFKNREGQIVATPRQRLSWSDWVASSAIAYEPEDFWGVMKYAFIETSRGCLYRCHFCPQPMLSGTERYLKPAKNVVDEMVELYKKEGITHFELVGSTTPPSQAEEIAKEVIGRGFKGVFSWVLFMRGQDERANNIDRSKLMETIKEGGASAIFFGVEAADNATLRKMGKGERIEEIEAAMLAAKNAGIATIGSFIYPYPGMPENEGALILDFLKRTQPLSAPVQALGLYPGTYDALNAEAIGCEICYPNQLDQLAYELGKKAAPSMQSPEVLSLLLRYPLILSLPMKLWPPLPYKIDGLSYKEYVKKCNELQKKISKLGILLGFSHSHHLISQVLGLSPEVLAERLFYCSLTGDTQETDRLIELFNSRIQPLEL